jgi:hypothetical protein
MLCILTKPLQNSSLCVALPITKLTAIHSTTFLFREEDDPILCPITDILALAFADDAFEAPSLKSPEQIFKLKVKPPVNSVQLKWKNAK